jgi:DNA-binding Lrp family transcriptional regulator
MDYDEKIMKTFRTAARIGRTDISVGELAVALGADPDAIRRRIESLKRSGDITDSKPKTQKTKYYRANPQLL